MSLPSAVAGSYNDAPTAFFDAADAVAVAEDPIDSEQIELVRTTWTYVAPMAEQAATLFYNRLFELEPAIKRMFAPSNLRVEKRILMQTVGTAVKHLHRPEKAVPTVRGLGRRHACCGVQERHYDVVAEALLWALEKGLGNRFTHEVRDAWAVTCTLLADTLKDTAAAELHG